MRTATQAIQSFTNQGGQALQNFASRAQAAGQQAGQKLAQGFAGANISLTAAFASFDAKQKVWEAGFGRLGGVFKSVGEDFSKYVSLPIAAGFALSAKSAIEFESAFAGVKKTLNTTGLDAQQTEAEYARLSDGIRQMSREIPAAATEIAKVSESAGQLGIKREAILGFTRVMIDLGNSTNLSADQAATSLARLANITQLPQNQFQNLGSAIVALGNNFATTEAEITEMGLRLAGAGKQVGLTEADILGFSTALSSVGIQAEAGGTAFSTVLKKIQVAVETGGKDLQGFARVAGQSSQEFKTSFQKNAGQAVVSFIEGLGRIKAAGGSTIQMLGELDLGNIRTSDSLLRLANAGDLTRRAVELSGQAFQENSALSKEAGQRYETTASQIQVAKNRLNDLGITIGNLLLPAIKSMSSLIGGASDALNNMSPAAAQTTLVVAGLVAAVGPLALGIGAVISLLPTLAAGFTALGTAVTFATGPIGLAIAGAAALAGGIYYLSQANERAKSSFEQQAKANSTLSGSVSPLLDRYDQLATKTKLSAQEQEELASIIKKVDAAVPGVVNRLDEYGNAIGISTDKTRNFIVAQQELAKAKASSAIGGAKADLAKYGAELDALQRKVAEFNRTGNVTETLGGAAGGITRQVALSSKQINELKEKLAEANLKYIEQEQYVAQLNATLGILPRTFQTIYSEQQNLEKALTSPFLKGIDAANGFNKAVAGSKTKVDITPVIEPQTLAKLREDLKAATERRDNATLGSKEFTGAQAEVKRLQELISKYEDAGKAAKKAASEITKAFEDVRKKLSGVDTQVKLGITAEGMESTSQKIKILEDGLKRLSELGVGSANRSLQQLNTQLLTLQQSLTKGIDPITVMVTPEVKIERTLGDKLGKDIASIIGPELANRPLTLPVTLPVAGQDKAQALLNTTLELDAAMRTARGNSLAFGASFDYTGARIGALQTGIQSLLAAGFSPLSIEVQNLVSSFNQLSTVQTTLDNFNSALSSTLVTGMQDIASGFGEAIGQILSGASGFEALPAIVLGAIGNLAVQVGQLAIGTGLAVAGIKAALTSLNPALAIAGGIALVALGTAVKGAASRIGNSGGSASGVSNYSGGRYTSPDQSAAAKAKPVSIEVTFKPSVTEIEGNKLRIINEVNSYRLRNYR
ncbi:phage tail tape measure protein [Hymenobacter sp. HSC-4F20]|uniref:phage tail tape measure protein n=1 Tax=Hymenobacter sp. HSC-4F20 TaxID=2864135 RepID=UPI001C731416|nr:phage tail tape measure protein [Hymenobacter sp. HSC-4F20]